MGCAEWLRTAAWMAIEGRWLYGHTELAAVHRVYLETGRLLEKYDVAEDRPGAGEHPTQDGFGWTNGTSVALRQWYAK